MWVGLALEFLGIGLAIWGKLELNAFTAAENAAGRKHEIMELFKLTVGWLAAFWGGVLIALIGCGFLVAWLLDGRRARASRDQNADFGS